MFLFTRFYFSRLNISIMQFYKGFIQELFLIKRHLSEFSFHLEKETANSTGKFLLSYGINRSDLLVLRLLVCPSTNHLPFHRLTCRRANWGIQRPKL